MNKLFDVGEVEFDSSDGILLDKELRDKIEGHLEKHQQGRSGEYALICMAFDEDVHDKIEKNDAGLRVLETNFFKTLANFTSEWTWEYGYGIAIISIVTYAGYPKNETSIRVWIPSVRIQERIKELRR